MAAFMCVGAIKTRNLEAKFTLHLVMIAVKTGLNLRRISQGGKSDQFLPWLTIDPTTGALFAVYYDRRETDSPTENKHLFSTKYRRRGTLE
jgi:hypothetical protein